MSLSVIWPLGRFCSVLNEPRIEKAKYLLSALEEFRQFSKKLTEREKEEGDVRGAHFWSKGERLLWFDIQTLSKGTQKGDPIDVNNHHLANAYANQLLFSTISQRT